MFSNSKAKANAKREAELRLELDNVNSYLTYGRDLETLIADSTRRPALVKEYNDILTARGAKEGFEPLLEPVYKGPGMKDL